MNCSGEPMGRKRTAVVGLLILGIVFSLAATAWAAKRAMTFRDVIEMRAVSGGVISPDGRSVLYTVSIPDWKNGTNFTKIFLARTDGSALPRQMTFSPEKNDTSPRWAPDSRSFAFLSDREGSNQLYVMPANGGEPQRRSDGNLPVASFAFTPDGDSLAWSAGKGDERQIYLLKLRERATAPTHLTRHATPVGAWAFAPDATRIFFTAPDSLDTLGTERRQMKFDVRIADEPKAPSHLWSVDVVSGQERRWTSGNGFSVQTFSMAPGSQYIALKTNSTSRYASEAEDSDIYLLTTSTGEIRRLTQNHVAESLPVFSPDGKTLAFSANEDFAPMRNAKIYVYPLPGGPLRKLLPEWDHNSADPSWGSDSRILYFTEGTGVDQHMFSVTLDGKLLQLTHETGVVTGGFDLESRLFLFTYTNPEQPADYYVARLGTIGDRDTWMRISNANPQAADLLLGQYETIHWESKDGRQVEGILVKPVGYESGKRYPLIVQVHGGPASAEMNSFAGRYTTYANVYAANGYAVFQPNYRGSDNYGEKFRTEIAGDYFRAGFDDIMTGVDYLIGRGVADPDRLGMMGWSAGGHWSNWTLTHTDRFKAISSGAGAVDWISMYAETDEQAPREFYFRGKPWENWEGYESVSPLRYIRNAKTPTLIQVGEADQRVPKPQSDELFVALKKLGVPVEYIIYPGMPHGLTAPRYQMVKMVAEFNWFEKWINGKDGWIDWKPLLASVGQPDAASHEAGDER